MKVLSKIRFMILWGGTKYYITNCFEIKEATLWTNQIMFYNQKFYLSVTCRATNRSSKMLCPKINYPQQGLGVNQGFQTLLYLERKAFHYLCARKDPNVDPVDFIRNFAHHEQRAICFVASNEGQAKTSTTGAHSNVASTKALLSLMFIGHQSANMN